MLYVARLCYKTNVITQQRQPLCTNCSTAPNTMPLPSQLEMGTPTRIDISNWAQARTCVQYIHGRTRRVLEIRNTKQINHIWAYNVLKLSLDDWGDNWSFQSFRLLLHTVSLWVMMGKLMDASDSYAIFKWNWFYWLHFNLQFPRKL